MRNIVFSETVILRVNKYAERYRLYFEDTYTDTGIWSEEMIVARYRELALERKKSLQESIIDRLTPDEVIGHSGHNSVIIPWRQKNLHITYENLSEDIRVVRTLEIK